MGFIFVFKDSKLRETLECVLKVLKMILLGEQTSDQWKMRVST